MVCLLATFPGMADDVRLQHLILQAQEAIARNDDAEKHRVVGEIYELTTGMDPTFKDSTESLSDEEYEKRRCLYHKAIAPLRTREELEVIRHEERFYAYIAVQQGETEDEDLRIRMECVQDNGEPVPEAKAMHEGLAWVKRFIESDIAEAQTMAREYDELSKLHPDDTTYKWLNIVMNAYVYRKRAELDPKNSEQRLIARNNEAERDRIFSEIFEQTTGQDAKLETLRDSLSPEEYEKRACLYFKATAPLHTQEELEHLGHEARIDAYRFITLEKTETNALRIRMKCVQDTGDPVPEAKALREGFAWAKRLHESDIAETNSVAQEYEALSKRHPGNEMYQWFHFLMSSLVDQKRAKRDREESMRDLEISTFRMTLAQQANRGDVAAQLEIARHLETGNKFEQNTHFAYYWYKRAQQNGGGEEAQKGMDRLLPPLTEIDLMRVKHWLEDKIPMY